MRNKTKTPKRAVTATVGGIEVTLPPGNTVKDAIDIAKAVQVSHRYIKRLKQKGTK